MAPADIGNAPPAYATSADPDPLRGKRIRLDGPTDRGQTADDGGNAAHLTPDPNSPPVLLLSRVTAARKAGQARCITGKVYLIEPDATGTRIQALPVTCSGWC